MQQQSLMPIMAAIGLSLAAYVGCEPDTNIIDQIANTAAIPTAERQSPGLEPTARQSNSGAKYVSTISNGLSVPSRAQETILVASFNIQTFGTEKLSDRWVMDRLAETVRQFDLVAIQEVRAKDQSIMEQLRNYVNASGGQYEYLLGPRLGRTNSKEQYAYLYDASRLMTHPDVSYTLNDDIDALHREPLIARFRVRTNRTANPWTFTIVDLHTDPDEAIAEVNAMGGIMKEIRNYEFAAAQEDDCILVGDLNAAPAKMQNLRSIAGMVPLINNQPTNVRETEIYDNVIIEPNLTAEFTGQAGVFNLREYFGLSTADALRLSDHNPVWAEFLVEERTGNNYSNQQMATPFTQSNFRR